MLSGPSACATNPQMVYDHRLPRTRRLVEVVLGTYAMVAYRLLSCNASAPRSKELPLGGTGERGYPTPLGHTRRDLCGFEKGTNCMMIPKAVKLSQYKDWWMYEEWLPMNVWRILLDDSMGPSPGDQTHSRSGEAVVCYFLIPSFPTALIGNPRVLLFHLGLICHPRHL